MDIVNAFLFKAWAWVPWVLGLGTIGWVALALLAPGLLNVISPFLRALVEGLVEVWKWIYEGMMDILDSWKTVFTVLVLLLAWTNYYTWKTPVEGTRTPTVKSQKVAPSKNTSKEVKEKSPFTLDGWDWFHK